MQRTRRVTLLDVAERAGVSTTTASYILNGHSAQMRIAPDTQRRVLATAADLGYRPNRSARTLRTATTTTIGLVSDYLAGGAYASQMLIGAGTAAREADHLLTIGETNGDPAAEALFIEQLIDRQVDGIIYATRTASRVRVPDILRERRTVLLNCVDPTSDLPSVLPDDIAGGAMASRLLMAAGITEAISVVGEDPTPDALAGPERLEGIRAALAGAGRELDGVVACEWAVDAAYDAVSRWLASGGLPCALICLNDRVAMGTYQALVERGLSIPGDVAVVSFDGSELATWLRPPVTSLALPFAELGAEAVRTLTAPGDLRPGVQRLPLSVQQGASLPPRPVTGETHGRQATTPWLL
jgi:LacI family transcriptional regulator